MENPKAKIIENLAVAELIFETVNSLAKQIGNMELAGRFAVLHNATATELSLCSSRWNIPSAYAIELQSARKES